MTEPALQVHSLTKKIGKKTIIDNVSFEVNKGEIFGLLGPNGAGKTTIIRMLVRLIKMTKGKVFISGYDIDSSYMEAISEIGVIVETPQFYSYMSGFKNLQHYARMSKKNITPERINEVIALVKLEKDIHQKVKTYSLGMRQRLGIAQALLHNPALLILDEPTNGLDPQGIRELRENLRLLKNEYQLSVLISSHLLSEMELICDRLAIIESGRLTHILDVNELDEETLEDRFLKLTGSPKEMIS